MMQNTSFRWPDDPTVSLSVCGEGGTAILVLPGGGYNTCSPTESDPVAERFASLGYRAYVLRYSVRFKDFHSMSGTPNPHTIYPEPLCELAAAIRFVRAEGAERVVLMGFSAGGHLASNYSNYWSGEKISGKAPDEALRPDACVLGYAATELTPDEMILGAVFGERKDYPAELRNRYTAKYHVSAATAPTFLFHSVTDPMVPARESVELSLALDAAGVPWEMHLFGCGGHAYGLGDGSPCGAWVELADAFIRRVLNEPEQYDKQKVREAMLRHFAAMHPENADHRPPWLKDRD